MGLPPSLYHLDLEQSMHTNLRERPISRFAALVFRQAFARSTIGAVATTVCSVRHNIGVAAQVAGLRNSEK